jgi:hypothetical protein
VCPSRHLEVEKQNAFKQEDAAQCLADALIKEEGGDSGALAAR